MARAAVPGGLTGRLAWRVGRLVDAKVETPSTRTLVLNVPGWPGHLPGQHVDIRLTAEDGYQAQRSYSIASAPAGPRVELTVQRVPDGEVSPYLTDVYAVGDPIELRGPLGGWFVWRPGDPGPVLLVGGGSGIVPLMAMLRTRAAVGSRAPFRLIYSVRTPADVYFAGELSALAAGATNAGAGASSGAGAGSGADADDGANAGAGADAGAAVTLPYTRAAPPGHPRPPGRISAADLSVAARPWAGAPATYVCGPTGFVEAVADQLVALGLDPERIRTERFGPTGEQ